jgi:serine/threonine protein kinase
MRNNFVDGALLNGRFRTLAPLNHGSFGMVFKARDTWTGEEVALKCLTKPSASGYSSALAVDDRSEELAIHRQIGEHRNIINLVTQFETEHHIYLVLEFCANGDLYEAIRIGRGPGQTEHVRECMLQLVDAVEHMHSKGVYHRDIKPENILLDKLGAMKLGDFGLATMDNWSFEAAVGSDRYMAPEQFDPTNTGYSPAKADIWAIGICLLNILFSRNPFATPTLSDPLFSDFYNDKQTLFDVFPNMSQDTYEVLVHSLAMDPAKRSLSAVKEALLRAVTFTTDDESLDDFCIEDTVTITASAHREPLRTPSISTPHLDQNGAFPWAKALAMSPPVRQLSAIPDTELAEPLYHESEKSDRDWFSVKPETASLASFVDSGLGLSFKSTNMELKPDFKFTRSKAVPISGSLPVSIARPIPNMASVFNKKRDFVSKSWSDLWDEEEEENAEQPDEEENDHILSSRGRAVEWKDESDGRDTPRVGLMEMKNPATVNNSRNRTPEAARTRDIDDVSEHTGFIFEDDLPTLPATPITPGNPRYSPPSKRSLIDKWAVLGDRRRNYPTPSKTPAQSTSAPPRKRSRAGSWRARNIDATTSNNKQQFSHHEQFKGVLEQLQGQHSRRKEGLKTPGPWTASKDWRRHASPQQDDELSWVWRQELHL